MEEAIAANVKRGVWIPVTHASPWDSAIVPVLKRNGTLRLCADYKGMVNSALSSDTYKSPTVDQVLSELTGGCIYGTIDLEEAYTQILVDGETSHMLTHTKISYVKGTTVAEYLARLLQVSHILCDAGFNVNSDKCVWQSASIEVLGFRLDAESTHPSTDKTAAITNAPSPCTKQELQSLLGLISFYGRFFKDKATILEPLHCLLDSKSKWVWTTKHQVALKTVKDMLTSHQVLAHYNPDLPLVVTPDASPISMFVLLILYKLCALAHPCLLAKAMGRTFCTHLTQLHSALEPSKPASAFSSKFQVGELMWMMKHRIFAPELAERVPEEFVNDTSQMPASEAETPESPQLLHSSITQHMPSSQLLQGARQENPFPTMPASSTLYRHPVSTLMVAAAQHPADDRLLPLPATKDRVSSTKVSALADIIGPHQDGGSALASCTASSPPESPFRSFPDIHHSQRTPLLSESSRGRRTPRMSKLKGDLNERYTAKRQIMHEWECYRFQKKERRQVWI
ncbi:hypothetical protein PR048_021110 [Dryococelus australis]|uniref:Reverse transcriptase/retrotransposon-derived protein RNase H-like domain-containing protein n=1 Tax=Dryococelus australis TaxID=614101 RepID=A0ABQ9GXB3_9NEOP|nr:hypothetical protein PR048_021110 [Dryococelus australis]